MRPSWACFTSPEIQTRISYAGRSVQGRSKHGNYNAWLTEIGFDSIRQYYYLRSDHIPLPGYLDSVLVYFDDPAIGYVQAPQAYYNQEPAWSPPERQKRPTTSTRRSRWRLWLRFPDRDRCHTITARPRCGDVGGFAAHDAGRPAHYRPLPEQGWQGSIVPRILARGLHRSIGEGIWRSSAAGPGRCST